MSKKNLFGNISFGLFDNNNKNNNNNQNLFGSIDNKNNANSLFGSKSPSLFENLTNNTNTGSLFGQNNDSQSLFGDKTNKTNAGHLFGQNNNNQVLFGNPDSKSKGNFIICKNNSNENKTENSQKGLFDFSANNSNNILFNKNTNLFEGGSFLGNKNMTNNINIFTNNKKDNDIGVFKKEENKVKNDANPQFSGLFQNKKLALDNNIDLSLKKDISFGNKDNNTNNYFQEINTNSTLFDKDKNNLENSDFNNNLNMFQSSQEQDNISIQDNNNDNNLYSNDEGLPEDNKGKKNGEVGKVIKISEELNKPDELGDGCTDDDYIRIINDKMKKYKRSLDNKVEQIESNKEELRKQEQKFNKFIEAINTSKKIIICINDNLNSNARELEEICMNQEKIIDDLDDIEKKLDEKIKDKRNKDDIVKENEDKNKKIETSFNNIEKGIEKCHEIMKAKNNVVENKEIKTMNQLLNRIHCRIKKDVQGKQIEYIQKIYKAEKNYISDK